MIYLIVGVLALLAFWIIFQYNFFVSTKARIKASVQEIGNQLKRQSNLIPNLEASAKGYLKHEKGIFEELADARKAIDGALKSNNLQKMSEAGDKLAGILPNIRVAVESNPEIKGSEVVAKLMDELRDTADKLMYARRLVIDLSADFNIRRVSFPSSLVATMFKFEEQKGISTPESGAHVEVTSEETKSPKVNL